MLFNGCCNHRVAKGGKEKMRVFVIWRAGASSPYSLRATGRPRPQRDERADALDVACRVLLRRVCRACSRKAAVLSRLHAHERCRFWRPHEERCCSDARAVAERPGAAESIANRIAATTRRQRRQLSAGLRLRGARHLARRMGHGQQCFFLSLVRNRASGFFSLLS